MSRRLLCLYFPSLAIDRLQREDPARRLRPFAVTREEKGHSYIAGVNNLATRAGIAVGARLADARTLLPDLDTVPDDPESNARVKRRLIEWCDRYSPLAADDGFGGIILDITGCAHLFEGEAALLKDLQARIRKTGYRVQGAVADTLGASWALARYGKRAIVSGAKLPGALDPLPVEALRLPDEISAELRRVGLTTIDLVRMLPRQSLATRYGPGILLRLDQAFSHAEEPIAPFRPPAPYRAGRTLAEPIATVSAVEYILLELLKEICARLEKEHTGARRLDLDCYRVDGTVARCSVITSRPVRSITHLMRLFAEKLDTVDAGFGIETLMLSVPGIDKSDPEQLSLPQFDQLEEDAALDELIDRFGMRLGFQHVCRFRVCESLLPEHAVEFRPVTAPAIPHAPWPEHRVRPVWLVDPPMRIEVFTAPPDELPVQFRIGQQVHRIARAEGPERLTPEWWRDESPAWKFRDYYWIEDDRGARFWIYQEMKLAPSWFLFGQLP
jgi:protein ImuB